MDSIVRNVGDLDKTDRSALERVVGHALGENQRVKLGGAATVARENPPKGGLAK